MLVLTRKEGQRIRIGDDIWIELVSVVGSAVRIGIEAPPDVNIVRTEIDNPRSRQQFLSEPKERHR